MRIIFAGTPEISAQVLTDLLSEQQTNKSFEIIATLTQPDRPKGRGRQLAASAVKILSQENDIPVYQPENLKNDEIINTLENLKPDLILVIAYGLIVPQNILDLPTHGCWNIHVSLLPKWRGAAPIQRAIEAGDSETGITIMQMDKGLDTGDILLQQVCQISQTDTSQSLHDKLAKLSAAAFLKTLPKLLDKNLTPIKQDNNQSTHAKKLTKEEAQINWSQSAQVINQKIRAFNPWPIAKTDIFDEKSNQNITIRIYQAEVINLNDIKSTESHGDENNRVYENRSENHNANSCGAEKNRDNSNGAENNYAYNNGAGDNNKNSNINLQNIETQQDKINSPGQIILSDKNNDLVIQCYQNQIKITHIQIPGKKAMKVSDLLNSMKYQELFSKNKSFI